MARIGSGRTLRAGPSRRALLGALGSVPFLAAEAAGQSGMPANLRFVVPFPAGGSADILSRIAADEAGAAAGGRRVIVENRPGAGGNIATEYVARSTPDGSTLLVAGQAILAINKALYPKLSYDPDTDFAFVAMLGAFANVLVVNPEVLPVKTVGELVELTRQQPARIAYGSNGPGSLSHLTTEVFAEEKGVKLLHVPYRGAGAGLMTDLLTGRIGMVFTGTATALPYVQAGQLRAIAVSTRERIREMPEVPTLIESGFPTLDAPTWFALMAPAKTGPETLKALRERFATMIRTPGYENALERQAMVVDPLAPDRADAFLARERAIWRSAVKTTGATAG